MLLRGEDTMARTRRRPTLAAAAACACLAALPGCAGGAGSGAAGGPAADGGARGTIPAIDVVAAATQLTEGESVRIEAVPRGGGDGSIDWISTGGQVTPDRDGRSATARFERSGTYTVTARLLVGGEEMDRDSTTIEVAPGGLAAAASRARGGARAQPVAAGMPSWVIPASAPATTPADAGDAKPEGGTPSGGTDADNGPDPGNDNNNPKNDDSTKEDPG